METHHARYQKATKRAPPVLDARTLERMDLGRLFDELVRAANKADITVRSESFDPNLSDARKWRGGLCVVRGKRVILVDQRAPLVDRIATIAASLASVDLEQHFSAARRSRDDRRLSTRSVRFACRQYNGTFTAGPHSQTSSRRLSHNVRSVGISTLKHARELDPP